MAEVDARLAMAELYSRIKSQAEARQSDRAARYSQFLYGLAVYSQATSTASTTTMTTYNFPSGTMTCVDFGSYVTCN
jgi:hypothetical protein